METERRKGMDEKIFQRRMTVFHEREQEMLREYGWFVHYVFDVDDSMDGMANIHTHGV